MSNINKRMAVVFGAASGIGAATAERLINDGYDVLLAGLPEMTLKAKAAALGANAMVCDVRDDEQIKAVLNMAFELSGRIDAVVNAAGVLVNDGVGQIDDAVWQNQLDINLSGAMRIMRAVLPIMQKQGSGSVVNVASVAAFNAGADMATYASSKAGMVALTRSAAAQYGIDGVRINAVCPGWVDTPMSQREMQDLANELNCSVPEAVQKTVARVALGRMAQPKEIAAVCAFLLSDEASFVTGVALVVDGGARQPAAARSN